jgi:hypothetical protein
MTQAEQDVWRETCTAMPPHWFTTQHLLRQYCRVVCLVQATANDDIDTLSKLTAMMLNLASKLRISPQGRVRPSSAEAAVRNTPRVKPWEDDDDEPAA